MKLLSINFVILWVIFFALYYLAPKKRQWMILAVASGLFYVVRGLRSAENAFKSFILYAVSVFWPSQNIWL